MTGTDRSLLRSLSNRKTAIPRRLSFGIATFAVFSLFQPPPLFAADFLVDPHEISATASSTLPPLLGRSVSYEATKTLDGKLDTGWSEGVLGSGIGESITYRLSKPMRITRIEIVNGYAKSPAMFAANARLRKAKISTDFGDKEVTLKDLAEWQTIIPNAGPTDSVRIEVLSAYQGTRYQDLIISEIRFWREADFSSPEEVGRGDESPLQRRDAPPEHIAAQLEAFVGAGPGEACYNVDQPEPAIIVDPATTEIGLFSNLCFTGFNPELPITVEVQASDGIVQTRQFTASYSYQREARVFFWLWPARPGMAAGRYQIKATQGNREATAALKVRPASTPRLRIVPFDPHDIMAGDFPPMAPQPGARFEILLAGFPPNASIALHIYGARDRGAVTYLTTVQITTDREGQTIYHLAAPPEGGDGVYCLGIDPEYTSRYYVTPAILEYEPNYRPDAQHTCFDTLFGVGKVYWGG